MSNVSNVNLDISRSVLPWGRFSPVYKEAWYLNPVLIDDQFSPGNSPPLDYFYTNSFLTHPNLDWDGLYVFIRWWVVPVGHSSSCRSAMFLCLLGATNDGVTRDLLTSVGSTSMMQTSISQWTNKYVRKIRPEAALCVWAAGRHLFFVICEKLNATRAKPPR